jgi:hypothetical protein
VVNPPPYGKWAIVYESVALLAWGVSVARSLLKIPLMDEGSSGVVWAAAIAADITINANRRCDFIPSIFHLYSVSHKTKQQEFTSPKC